MADLGALGGFAALLVLGVAAPHTIAQMPTLPLGIVVVAGAATAASALGARRVRRS